MTSPPNMTEGLTPPQSSPVEIPPKAPPRTPETTQDWAVRNGVRYWNGRLWPRSQ